MSCEEYQQKLSMYADRALREDELEAVSGHLAGCAMCRRQLEEQGALNMLLKSALSIDPPQSYLDAFWPTVSERLDEAPPGEESPPNGGGAKLPEGEIVFRSSTAMQILTIPERRTERAPEVMAAPVAPPAAPPWRWPLALIVSSAIIVGGFLYYKKTQTPTTATTLAAAPAALEPSAASQPATEAVDAGMKVALATTPEAGAEPGNTADDDPEPERGRPAAAHRPRRVRGKAEKAEPAAKGEGEPQAAPKGEVATSPGEAPAVAVKPKKKDDLDNLIDTAIGGTTVGTPKAQKAAPTPAGPVLPEQLTMPQIQGAMGKIKGYVQSCYDQYQVEGMAKVTFTIASDGTVGESKIKGKFFGTDTGSCVVGAVKKARFPKFSGKPMTINNYPFLLQ